MDGNVGQHRVEDLAFHGDPDTGAGVLTLELKNLVRSTAYSITLFKGPFIAPGSSWSSRGVICADLSDGLVVRLPAMRSSAAGTIVKSIALSAGQMTRISAIRRPSPVLS